MGSKITSLAMENRGIVKQPAVGNNSCLLKNWVDGDL
jgi:hypothetical protein